MEGEDNMATGSDFQSSYSLGSDQVFDRNCSLCKEDKKTKEAISSCTACCKYFCSQCLEFHNKLHRDHRNKLLDKSAMLTSLPKTTTSRGTLTKTCEQHDGKLLEMFCRQHNVVCCTVCLATKHKHCGEGQYIPEIADGFSKNSEVSKIKTELAQVKQYMLIIKSSKQIDQSRLNKEREFVLAQVKDSRRKINAHLDKLEESVIKGAEMRYQKYYESVQKDLAQCDEAIKKIDEAVKQLGDADTHNEPQLFVNVKTGGENVTEWRELGRQIQDQLGKGLLRFTVDESFVKCVMSQHNLGTFVDELNAPRKPPIVMKENEAVIPRRAQVVMKEKEAVIPRKARVVMKEEEAVIRMNDDDTTCRIDGSCCLPGGGALLTDYNNHKLKRMNSSYRVTDYLKINYPCDVCCIQQISEAAVTLGNEQNAIQIVSLGTRMKLERFIKLSCKWCARVTYNNGLLYVTQDNDKLCLYDYQSGQLQTVVDSDVNGQKLFSDYIYHVAINLDGTGIWIADGKKGLILLDRDLQLVRVVTDTDLNGATGVCTDHDEMLVCGYKSRSVLQLTRDGEKIATLVPRNGLPVDPVSMCLDNTRSRLIVTLGGYDSIRVLHLG